MTGLNDAVIALAVSDSGLCAGGFFTDAGNFAVQSIARWDGSSWSALGSGVNSAPVWAIAALVLLTEMILRAGGGVLVSNAHGRRNRDKLNRSIPQAEVKEWTGSS